MNDTSWVVIMVVATMLIGTVSELIEKTIAMQAGLEECMVPLMEGSSMTTHVWRKECPK